VNCGEDALRARRDDGDEGAHDAAKGETEGVLDGVGLRDDCQKCQCEWGRQPWCGRGGCAMGGRSLAVPFGCAGGGEDRMQLAAVQTIGLNLPPAAAAAAAATQVSTTQNMKI